ncbi:MAG: DNA polymerase III subunit chi [Methylobacillus sp.]|jgi:DNA polymerase-3 subunit chi|nr:DNA polymerase III subunit chi [Methylobacillus sp.]
MTRIDFYFNIEDKFRHIAELAQHALARRRRLFVYMPDAHATARLENTLWTHPPAAFLPHCRNDHPLRAETPIILDSDGENLPHDDVLINLTEEHPPFFSRFKGLIEVVGRDDNDRNQARARYRFYRDRGYEIKSHDVEMENNNGRR